MGLEYIVQPQVFLGGLTALGPGIQGLTEQYPLLTTYNYWTSTASVDASAFPIPGTWSIYDDPNNSASFIVTVGGLVQTPDSYSINIINRLLTFNSIISAGIEIGATQLATAAPSSISYDYIESVDSVITNLTSTNGVIENLFVTNLTALSTTVNVIDIQYSELSGFKIAGNLEVEGDVNITNYTNISGNLVAKDINSTNAIFTNLTATDLNILNFIDELNVVNLTATDTYATNSLVTNLTADNITTNDIIVNGPISASGSILALNTPTYYYLENNRAAIGNTTLSTTFFDPTASFILQPSKRYEMEYNLYYTKQTASNLVFGLSTVGNLSQINAFYFQSNIAGISANNTTTGAGIVSSSPTTIVPLPATGLLNTTVTHYTRMLIQVENLNATTFAAVLCCNTGTVTPLKGSYRKITLLS